MNALWIALIAFAIGYFLNALYITVFYHRGLAHGALALKPALRNWVALTGPWVTGLDPKGWVCMHRMHHEFSDTENDPHSPLYQGVIGLALGQLRSYEKTLRGLIKRREPYASVVKDLTFPVHYLNRKGLWYVPYVTHVVLAIALSLVLWQPFVGPAYFLGIMTHPVQGWMVNALAHRFGYRNFNTDDNSRNNRLVAWLVFGEGYQNNHHAFPQRANFAAKGMEVDLGYLLCKLPVGLGLANFPELAPAEPRLAGLKPKTA